MKLPKEQVDRAEFIYEWLAEQKYGDEYLLHAVVLCDFASKANLIRAIARKLMEFDGKEPLIDIPDPNQTVC
jgi:hypothetical protein